MTVNTDQLIQTLVADNGRREQPVGSVLAIALATGGAISTVLFLHPLDFVLISIRQFTIRFSI